VNDAHLPARLPPDKVARAAVAPAPLVAGVAGAAIGFAVFPPLGALIGLGTWAAGAAVNVARRTRGRRPRPPRIDPFTLHDPWRRHVQHALAAQRRFSTALGQFPAGPLRLRLEGAAGDLSAGVAACWRVAQRGELLTGARRSIDTNRVRANLASLDVPPAGGSDLHDHTREALEAQLASAERLDTTIEETRARLRLLDARLTEAVTRLVELAATGTAETAIPGVDDAAATIRGVSDDLEALRSALDELQRPPGEVGPGGGA
jgi:hypothetical protein